MKIRLGGSLEVEVTDPKHPLFGRRFAVIALPTNGDSVAVLYQDAMHLRLPLACTSLMPAGQGIGTKLTLASVTDLVTLATQCEVLCLSPQTPSGTACPRRSKTKSAAT
ncbi:MAG: hypothetical protein WAN46_18000 [Gammaproteobacteria bacterium]